MRQHRLWLFVVAFASTLALIGGRVSTQEGTPAGGSTALTCDMQQYKAMTGLTAAVQGNLLAVTWAGSDGSEVRARYAIDNGQPVVRDLAVRPTGGQWGILGENLKPEYRVVSGIRRFSSQQGGPLEGLGQLTPERAEKEKWYAYRDAPLLIAPPAAAGGRGGRGGGGDDEAPAAAGGRAAAGRGGAPSSRTGWRTCCAGVRIHVAQAGRHSPRERVVQVDVLQREDRRRAR